MRRIKSIGIWLVLLSVTTVVPAFATIDQAKLYKNAFGLDKLPKCTTCHVDKLPKKEDGKHEWNDYGKKLRAVKETPDEGVYKQVGKNEAAES